MTYQLLLAAEKLANEYDIQAEVIHFPTIKPLDEDAILDAAQKMPSRSLRRKRGRLLVDLVRVWQKFLVRICL